MAEMGGYKKGGRGREGSGKAGERIAMACQGMRRLELSILLAAMLQGDDVPRVDHDWPHITCGTQE